MKPPPFNYHCPSTLAEALSLVATLENAKILAGGQSLMPMLNMRFIFPDHIVDLNRIPELAGIHIEGDWLVIGALTRQRDIEQSDVVRGVLPIFQEALRQVGHVQTRNRGTIGGSLCHLDPAAELPTVVATLDGEVIATSVRGVRSVPMDQFPAYHMTPSIETDEIVTAVRLPIWRKGHGYAFHEFARRHGDFAVIGVAVLLEIDEQGTVGRAALCVSGIGHGPIRIQAAEQALIGRRPDRAVLVEVARLCANVPAEDDFYNSAAYRRHLCSGLAQRALKEACERGSQHLKGPP